MQRNSLHAKRAFDLVVSATGLLALSPVLGVLALLVRVRLGSPVLFRQERPGLHGCPFTMLKFRTMTDARGPGGALLPDAQRLTPLGRFLRSTSLDELPGLWNVLRGDMSLVGPRPLLVSYLDHFTPRQARRHAVRPGITGWAQINGRQDIPFSRRIELDLEYVERQSFVFDVYILLRTIPYVLQTQGVRSGHAMAQEKYDVNKVNDVIITAIKAAS